MKTSPRAAASSAGMTAKPSMRASSARSGSTSQTITDAPKPARPQRDAAPRPAVAQHDDGLPGQQEVRRAHDAVQHGLPGAEAIVERPLGARLVDRDHRHRRPPSASSARSRTSPVVVSSVPPSMPSSRSGRAACSAPSRSAPSSSVIRGARATTARDAVGPLVGPARVDLGLAAQRRRDVLLRGERVRRAQRDVRPTRLQRPHQARRLRRHVQARADDDARERPLAGEALTDRAEDGHLPVRPLDPASPDSGLVAIVVRLVRALDRHVDVGGLLGRELGQAHAERVEVQARDLLVEVLRAGRRPASRTRRSS